MGNNSMSAQHTPGPTGWTDGQWAYIVGTARRHREQRARLERLKAEGRDTAWEAMHARLSAAVLRDYAKDAMRANRAAIAKVTGG